MRAAAALFAAQPAADPEQMASWGLCASDFAESDGIELWPDTVQAFGVFSRLNTQWRVGVGGRTGLDYAAVPITLELLGIERAEWPALFDDLRHMERAALTSMHKRT